MNKVILAVIAAAALALTGCESTVMVENSTSISIEHNAVFKGDAYRKAAAHCQKYGKKAVHVTTTGGASAVSSFRCESPPAP